MVGILGAILTLSLVAGQGKFTLPSEAKIVIGRAVSPPGSPRSDVEECPFFHLTDRQVRWRFRHYHTITGPEQHYEYEEPNCRIHGSMTYRGKTFHWQANEGNLLWTNWPTGKDVVLGGKPTITPDME